MSKEQSHGSSESPEDDPSGNTGIEGLKACWDGIMVVVAPCALGSCHRMAFNIKDYSPEDLAEILAGKQEILNIT